MSSTCDSLISFPSFTSLATVNHVKRSIHSITQRVLVGLTVKLLSKVGQTSTLPLYPLVRWVQVPAVWPLMTVGAGGTGKRFWAWVLPFLNHIQLDR